MLFVFRSIIDAKYFSASEVTILWRYTNAFIIIIIIISIIFATFSVIALY